MTEIHTDYLRLALILRRAIGTGAADEYVVGDAKELILAARRIASPDADHDAIMRRLRLLLTSYAIKPYEMRGAIVLPLPNGFHFEVPR